MTENSAPAASQSALRHEFRSGWPTVVGAGIGSALGLPTIAFYTLGLFAPHLALSFGWNFASIYFAILLLTVTLAITTPLAGQLADRLGARTVVTGSQFLLAITFIGFGIVGDSIWHFYAIWLALGLLGAGATPATLTRPVIARFDRHRGLALGLALIGPGLFAAAIKPAGTYFIETLGWRGAYVAIGLLPLLIAVPASLLCFGTERSARRIASVESPFQDGMSLREAVRSWRFWLLAIIFVPVAFGLAGPLPHLEPMLAAAGFSATDTLQLTPIIGVALIAGRLIGGWLLDRLWAPIAGMLFLMFAASGSIALASSPGFAVTLMSLVLIGLAAGLEYDLLGYLATRYFGRAHYSAIYGALFSVFLLAGGAAPLIFGRAFDLSGSYQGVLQISAAGLVVAGLGLLALGPYAYAGGASTASSNARHSPMPNSSVNSFSEVASTNSR